MWVAASISACGPTSTNGDATRDAAVDTVPASWPCPSEWVAAARGGCGPAVWLCTMPGLARAGACDGVDLRAANRAFRVDGDGGLAGPALAPGDPSAPPPLGFRPDAGVSRCAPGWARETDGTCSARLRTDCAAGSEALPNGTCTRTSASECGTDAWPDPGPGSVGARVVRVRAGADPVGADGSEVRPFATVTAGVAAAGSGGYVLVAAGEYVETLSLSAPVHVIGRCAVRTVLRRATTGAAITLESGAMPVDVRGLSIRSEGSGLVVRGGARADVANVVVSNVRGTAIVVEGVATALYLSDSVVRDVLPLADGTLGHGLDVRAPAAARVADCVFADLREAALFASGPRAELNVEGSHVRDTNADRTARYGVGIDFEAGAIGSVDATLVARSVFAGVYVEASTVSLGASRIDGVAGGATAYAAGIDARGTAQLSAADVTVAATERHGLVVTGRGTLATVRDSAFVDTEWRSAEGFAAGVVVRFGARFVGLRVLAARNRVAGVLATDATTTASLEGGQIVQTLQPTDDAPAVGVGALEGAVVDARGVRIESGEDLGASASGTGAVLRLGHSVVVGPRHRSMLQGAAGVLAAEGGRCEVTSTRIEGSDLIGAAAAAPGSVVVVSHSIVRALGRGLSDYGIALDAETGGRLEATDTLVERVVWSGAYVTGVGSTMRLERVIVRDVEPEATGLWGPGVFVGSGAVFAARDVAIERVHEGGLVVDLNAGMTTLDHVLVRGVVSGPRGFGVGVFVFGGSTVTAARLAFFDVAGAALMAIPVRIAGVAETFDATARLEDIYVRSVRSSTIGIRPDNPSRGTGVSVAYGLHVGERCLIDARRVAIDGGGFGFYNSRGRLALRSAAVTRQLDAVGAYAGNAEDTQVTDRTSFDNASETIARNDALPEGASIPPPTRVCSTPPCP